MDAFPPPLESHLNFLSKTVKAILAGRPPPLPPQPPSPPPRPANSRPIIWMAAATALILLGAVWFFVARPSDTGHSRPEPQPTAIASATVAVPVNTPAPNEAGHPETTAAAEPSIASRSAIPQIAGIWREKDNRDSGAQVTQDGNNFSFQRWGVLPDGTQFKGSGSGTLSGLQLRSRYSLTWYHPYYQTSSISSGECTGSVSADGTHMVMTCNDSLFGYSAGEAYREQP
jgi:hypothetical protein